MGYVFQHPLLGLVGIDGEHAMLSLLHQQKAVRTFTSCGSVIGSWLKHQGAAAVEKRLRDVDGRYEPMEIVDIGDGILQGHIAVLDLNLRWEDGQLAWHDPATGQHIATFDSERSRAEAAAAELAAERARIRELEAELRRRGSAS